MVIGFDISTSITGVAVIAEGQIVYYDAIDLRKYKDMFDKTYDGSNIHGGTTTTTTDTSTDGGGYDPNVHGPTDYGKGSDGQQSYDLNPGSGVGWSATGSGPVSNKTGRGRTDWVDGGLVSIL